MKHMTKLFGLVFNQTVVEAMVGKYLKSMKNNFHGNICHRVKYECPRLIPIYEWDTLIEDAKEKQ